MGCTHGNAGLHKSAYSNHCLDESAAEAMADAEATATVHAEALPEEAECAAADAPMLLPRRLLKKHKSLKVNLGEVAKKASAVAAFPFSAKMPKRETKRQEASGKRTSSAKSVSFNVATIKLPTTIAVLSKRCGSKVNMQERDVSAGRTMGSAKSVSFDVAAIKLPIAPVALPKRCGSTPNVDASDWNAVNKKGSAKTVSFDVAAFDTACDSCSSSCESGPSSFGTCSISLPLAAVALPLRCGSRAQLDEKVAGQASAEQRPVDRPSSRYADNTPTSQFEQETLTSRLFRHKSLKANDGIGTPKHGLDAFWH